MIIAGSPATSSGCELFPIRDGDLVPPSRPSSSSVKQVAEVFDPFFGIKISSPRFTLETFDVYCKELRKARLSSVSSASSRDEIVTMAVIVESSGMKKSANGKDYLIWHLSDLASDSKVKILLFAEAAQAHWKVPVGFAVALTNPELATDSGTTKPMTTTLKINKSLQVLSLGLCPDFGICRGTKKSGERCTNHVNISSSPVCSYHIQSEAQKLRANRSSLSGMANERPKCMIFKSPPKPAGLFTVNRPTTSQSSSRVQYTAGDRAAKARLGHRAVLNLNELDVQNENRPPLVTPTRRPSTSNGPNGASNLKEFIEKRTKSDAVREAGNRLVPRQVERGRLVDLMGPQKVGPRPQFSKTEEAARKRATEIFKKSLDSKAKPIKRGGSPSSRPDEKKSRLTSSQFSNDRIRELLNKKSTHEHEVLRANYDREQSYFEQKEVEEKVETHATTLMEIKEVNVVTCKVCSYTATHLAQRCVELEHEHVRHKAAKRFFKCKECRTRTGCFGLMPTKPCVKCGSKDFERVAMRDERKIEIREKLQLRGEERTFVNK